MRQPRKSRPWSIWVIFVFSADRRRPIGARTAAAYSRICAACSRVPETMSSQSSAYAEDRVMPMLAMESLVRVVSGFLVSA